MVAPAKPSLDPDQLQRREEAIADYDRAIGLDPDRAGTYLCRCRANSDLGWSEGAVAA